MQFVNVEVFLNQALIYFYIFGHFMQACLDVIIRSHNLFLRHHGRSSAGLFHSFFYFFMLLIPSFCYSYFFISIYLSLFLYFFLSFFLFSLSLFTFTFFLFCKSQKKFLSKTSQCSSKQQKLKQTKYSQHPKAMHTL